MKPSLATIGIALLVVAVVDCCGRPSDSQTLTVSVAASLQNAMSELAPVYERSQPGIKVVFNFGGSGTLEQQIERGAPADVFLAASPKQMDALAAKGLILTDTRRDLLCNQVVLIAPKGSTRPNSFQDLSDETIKLIALGDPVSVPAGDYGRQVLQSLHVWAAVHQTGPRQGRTPSPKLRRNRQRRCRDRLLNGHPRYRQSARSDDSTSRQS
jgi:molybdate transport system substrate-binding protein